MRFSVSAGGFAAACLLCLFGIFDPTPSRAWQIKGPPPAVPALPAPSKAVSPEPAVALPPPAASLERETADDQAPALDSEDECLATAVYFEAKGEPMRGQLAVAQVIVNRTRSGRFPDSLCGVVRQRGQFSFVRAGHLPAVPRGCAAWRKAVAVAHTARRGLGDDRPAGDALFFHARYVSPSWHSVRVATIGNQIFYR
jgi:N-acetylmuramoyl-L-alanine amidase